LWLSRCLLPDHFPYFDTHSKDEELHCQQCGAEHNGNQRLCLECQRVLRGASTPSLFNAGESGFGIAKGGVAPLDQPLGAKGGLYAGGIERTHVYAATFRGRPARISEFREYGVAITVFSVVGFVFAPSAWWLVLLLPSLFSINVGTGLRDKRVHRVASVLTVEANKSGHVFLTQIGGECPICCGSLGLREIKDGKQTKAIIQCKENSLHRWDYDPKVLEELSGSV
jgi:hypothetical protein